MTARRPLKASALFTIRRSGCVPAEPYPPNRTNRVAPSGNLCYAFLNFRHANGGVQTQNKNRFYILARPFCCPALGERLTPRQRKTENPRNPYRIKDYERIDPEFGTREDLRAFVNEAHRLGLRVLMDIVYLHCGPGAVLIERHPSFMKRDDAGNLKLANWGFPAIDFPNWMVFLLTSSSLFETIWATIGCCFVSSV